MGGGASEVKPTEHRYMYSWSVHPPIPHGQGTTNAQPAVTALPTQANSSGMRTSC